MDGLRLVKPKNCKSFYLKIEGEISHIPEIPNYYHINFINTVIENHSFLGLWKLRID